MEKNDKTLIDNELSDDKTLIDNSADDVKTKLKNSKASDNNKPVINDDAEIDEKTGKKKIIDQKAAMLVGGGVLLSGTAYAAGKIEDDAVMIDTDNDNVADVILTDENHDGVFNLETEAEQLEENDDVNHNNIEQSNNVSGHPFNINTAPHASEGTVNDNMSFAEAFAAARAELGPGGVFEWHGQLYGTFYATEVDENHNPIIDYETVEPSELTNSSNNNETVVVDEVEEVSDDVEPSDEIIAEVETVTDDNEIINENEVHEINTEVEDIDEIVGVDIVDTGDVDYDGEIASDVPEDVPSTDIDFADDDIVAVNDNDFDDISDWA